ncbi:MAG TPA: DUF2306 domain-containing protein [Acidobacteriaceae bacterium]
MSSIVTTPLQGAAPAKPAWLRPKYALFACIALMYAYVLWHNESFLINSKDPEWQHIGPFKWILLPHGLAAACALFLGPLQFSDRLRKRFAKAHRVMGRFYVAGVLLGAPMGIYVQHWEERMGATSSFTMAAAADAVVWIFATAMAMMFILQGKVQLHRQWMTRSFACAIIFLEVRLISGLTHWEQYIETIVWCCVVAAFPLADLTLQIQEWLRTRNASARKPQPAT